MKVLITCAVWKRPQIFEIMTAGLQRMRSLMDTLGVDSQVLFIVDETDEQNTLLIDQMATADANILHVTISNDMPLGERMNRAMDAASGLDWDYMMQMGSDDLISDAGVLALMSYAFNGCPFFGFRQIYFVDSVTKRMKQMLTSNTFGAGRMVSREIYEKTGVFWDANQRSCLDNYMQESIYSACGVMPSVVNTWRPAVFDIKSGNNVNPYNKYLKKETPLNVSMCNELKYVAQL